METELSIISEEFFTYKQSENDKDKKIILSKDLENQDKESIFTILGIIVPIMTISFGYFITKKSIR